MAKRHRPYTGVVTNPTAGTRGAFSATSKPVYSCAICALPGNNAAGIIYIGDENVSATRYMAAIATGEQIDLLELIHAEDGDTVDLADWYYDVSVTNDDISFGGTEPN